LVDGDLDRERLINCKSLAVDEPPAI